MTYRIATLDDVIGVYNLMIACAGQLYNQGYSNWDHITVEQTEKKIKKGRTYILEDDNILIGTITIGKQKSTFFISEDERYWHNHKLPPGYIRSLAVHPKYQKNGYGTRLMHMAENVLKQKGFGSARLTAVTRNNVLCTWYISLGYIQVQERIVPEKNTSLSFFEKLL